jgi:imidazoleglycerol-phosphate dehydratase / histidinol-phosphatase
MTRILFVDRDGTLIEEPPDCQIDAYHKLRFVPGMLPALLRLRDAGYQFVMVSNQDGLGTASFPRADFEGPQALLLQLLESQGIVFREVLIDPSLPGEGAATRKPGIGMVLHYLHDREVDLAESAVVGDRDSDLEFARNLGVRGFRIGAGGYDWAAVAHELAMRPRVASIERATAETRIRVRVDLDRVAPATVATGIGFFDHMLEQLGRHGGFALDVHCAGDLHVDEHHTVEDCALALGQALRRALGDKRGLQRYGAGDVAATAAGSPTDAEGGGDGIASVLLPMDESLARAALDLSGRPLFVFDGRFPRAEVGGLPTELVPHFFRSLCDAGGINLHLAVRGDNTHHMVEACFKAVARALRQAIRREGSELPSTKGVL